MQVMQQAFSKIADKLEAAKPDYAARGMSHKRYRWDALRATRLNVFGDGVGTHGDLNLYAYMNDDHIDSALRAILGDKF
jgi:hypothetical protein